MYLALALASACLAGVWEFGTGHSGRRLSLYVVILVSASAAILTYLSLGFATHNLEFDGRDVAAGLFGGFLNFLGTILLLKALATGKMGVASGVVPAYVLIPIAYSLMIGESIGLLPAVGIVVILLGLVLFCAYDLIIVLRETPESAFIMDDLLIHLALVPGGLSLLGYLLGNPTYLSIHADPRVGISPLEMAFMGLYAVAAVVSNPRLFLWQFLAASWSNRLVFGLLFLNQFVAPLVVELSFSTTGTRGPGIERFVLLAGVLTTMAFLLMQARVARREAL